MICSKAKTTSLLFNLSMSIRISKYLYFCNHFKLVIPVVANSHMSHKVFCLWNLNYKKSGKEQHRDGWLWKPESGWLLITGCSTGGTGDHWTGGTSVCNRRLASHWPQSTFPAGKWTKKKTRSADSPVNLNLLASISSASALVTQTAVQTCSFSHLCVIVSADLCMPPVREGSQPPVHSLQPTGPTRNMKRLMMVCLLQQGVRKIKQQKIFKDAFRCISNFNSLCLVAKAKTWKAVEERWPPVEWTGGYSTICAFIGHVLRAQV